MVQCLLTRPHNVQLFYINNGTVAQGAAVLKTVHKCRGKKCNFEAGRIEVDVAAGLEGPGGVQDKEGKEGEEVLAQARRAGVGVGAARHQRGSGRKRKRRASCSATSEEEEEEESSSSEEEEEEEEEEERGFPFEVEKIVDHRRRKKNLEYKIKWKGYSNKSNSWEDDSGLDAPDALAAYKKTKRGSALKED